MKLSIIIVSWNVETKLKNNLESIYKSVVDFDYEVIVVDNYSSDNSVGLVRENFPQVKIISNDKNFGFAKAVNQGIALSSGDFILLLNPDMLIFPETLQNFLHWLELNPQAVVSSGRLLDENDQDIRHVRRFPRLFDQLAVVLKLPHLFPKILNAYLLSGFNYNQPARVDSVRGSFFMINRQAYRQISGGAEPLLDETYFIWFEEVDFCRQVYKLGGEVWYTPVAVARDYIGQSFKKVDLFTKQTYVRKAMLTYFKKWHKSWEYLILKIVWSLIFVPLWIRRLF